MRTLHRHSTVCSDGQLHSHSTVSWCQPVPATAWRHNSSLVARAQNTLGLTAKLHLGTQGKGNISDNAICTDSLSPQSTLLFSNLSCSLCASPAGSMTLFFQAFRSNVKSSVKSWKQKNGKICVSYLSASDTYLLWLIRTRFPKRHLTNQICSIVQQRYAYQLGNA